MDLEINIFFYILLMISGVYLFIAYIALRSKSEEGHLSFGILMIAAAVYSVGYFFEVRSADVETLFLWIRFEYFGISIIPALWIIFIIRYCGYHQWLKKYIIVLLWIVPAGTLLLLNTNQMHNLFYSDLAIAYVDGLSVAIIDRGFWYLVHMSFLIFSFIFSSALLLYTYIKSFDIYRKRFLFLFLGSLIIWIAFLLYIFGNTPMNIDLIPFALAITGLIYIYNLIHYKMFDFMSAARSNVFDSIQDAILVMDSNERIVDLNDIAKSYFDNKTKMEGVHIDRLFNSIEFNEKETLETSKDAQSEGLIKIGEEEKWLDIRTSILKDRKGKYQGKILILRDITYRKKSEEALQKSEEKYRSIFDHSPLGILHYDKKGIITDCNDSLINIIGSSREALIGLNMIEKIKNVKVAEAIHTTLQGSMAKYEGIYYSVTTVKETPVRALFTPLFSMGKEVLGGAGIIEDITERKKYEEKLKYMSMHDKLTGLYNRALFEEEIKRLEDSREYPITIMSCDVDGLKIINDTIGHDKGDELLKTCSEILKKSLRKSDIIARVGGDEFALILPMTDEIKGEKIADRIEYNVNLYNKQNQSLPLSVSIGVTTVENKEMTLSKALQEADERMYHQKLIQKKSSRSQIIYSLLAALGEKDFITEGHSIRLAAYCEKIGKKLNLSSNIMANLNLLAQVHDLGKVGIPDKILFKSEPLTEEEWIIMKKHPEKGYRIAAASPDLAGVADLILKHHEKWDGTGYQLGIKGTDIPIECRILAIVDAYDAMTNKRPYNKVKNKKEAVEELKTCSGTHFDPELVELFLLILLKE